MVLGIKDAARWLKKGLFYGAFFWFLLFFGSFVMANEDYERYFKEPSLDAQKERIYEIDVSYKALIATKSHKTQMENDRGAGSPVLSEFKASFVGEYVPYQRARISWHIFGKRVEEDGSLKKGVKSESEWEVADLTFTKRVMEKWTLSLGRQKISETKEQIFRVNDVLNPVDNRMVLSKEKNEQTLATTITSVEYIFSLGLADFSAFFYLDLENRASIQPEPGHWDYPIRPHGLPFRVSVEKEKEDENKEKRPQGFILKGGHGDYALTALYLKRSYHLPRLLMTAKRDSSGAFYLHVDQSRLYLRQSGLSLSFGADDYNVYASLAMLDFQLASSEVYVRKDLLFGVEYVGDMDAYYNVELLKKSWLDEGLFGMKKSYHLGFAAHWQLDRQKFLLATQMILFMPDALQLARRVFFGRVSLSFHGKDNLSFKLGYAGANAKLPREFIFLDYLDYVSHFFVEMSYRL